MVWTVYYRPQNEVWDKVMFLTSLWFCSHGGGHCPSMHYRSYDQGSLCPGGLSGVVCSGGLWPGGASLSKVGVRGYLSRSGITVQGGSLSRGSLSRGSLSRGSLSRGLCLGGLCPGVGLCLRVSVQGGLYPGRSLSRGWYLSRGSLSRGCLSKGSLSKGVSVQGGLCLGGSVQGSFCQGGFTV